VVHQDHTARPQTVKEEVNPRYYQLIKYFGVLTGEYAVLNTSFNVKGEPIICTPHEAVRCYYDSGIDLLVLSNYILEKHL
jgi:carbamoyltransferase